MIEIPLTNNPEQFFSVTLTDITYNIRVLLNSRTLPKWSISFYIGDVAVVEGVMLCGGVNILSQHNIAVKNAYVINLDDPAQDPTREDLGTDSVLVILTDEEVSSG